MFPSILLGWGCLCQYPGSLGSQGLWLRTSCILLLGLLCWMRVWGFLLSCIIDACYCEVARKLVLKWLNFNWIIEWSWMGLQLLFDDTGMMGGGLEMMWNVCFWMPSRHAWQWKLAAAAVVGGGGNTAWDGLSCLWLPIQLVHIGEGISCYCLLDYIYSRPGPGLATLHDWCFLLLCCSSGESLSHCSAWEASQCPGFNFKGRDVWAQCRAGCGVGILGKGNCSLAL